MVKLLDFAADEDRLESSNNPFAVVILAHLKAQQTVGDHADRRSAKLRLIRGLYNRGWSREDVWELVRLIDWVLRLPKPMEVAFREELAAIEQEKRVPYVTSFKRPATEEGEPLGEIRGIAMGEAKGVQEGTALWLCG
jgi:hypothetical protein